ncbi:MAG TPA: carboxypeptidase-like regulatory domain-containing protein, partial [Planctomycetota bacterium]|nr:carboxypeptidase-like regulatory domain-containing protein [Planctomycetota bacterium]
AEDAADPPGFDPIRRGRVVDAVSGEPIAGAHVKFVALLGEGWGSWGAATGPDGSFRIDVERFRPAGHRLEYRVWVEGRRPWRGPAGEGETVIGMEAESGRPAPGRIRGVARLPDGTALSGTLVVTLLGEMLDWHHRWTVADAAGGFLLEGVAPGEWQVRVKGSRNWSAALVPEGGEAAIAVVVDDPPRPPPPWTEEREQELAVLEREILVLDRRRTAGETEAPAADRPAEPIEHQMRVLHDRIAPLEESRRASLPRREVEVQGLPDEPYATLEASGHGRVWVREASDGRVRFPPLEEGRWTLTLRRRTAYPEVRTIEVVDGDGPMIEQFAAVRETDEAE